MVSQRHAASHDLSEPTRVDTLFQFLESLVHLVSGRIGKRKVIQRMGEVDVLPATIAPVFQPVGVDEAEGIILGVVANGLLKGCVLVHVPPIQLYSTYRNALLASNIWHKSIHVFPSPPFSV